jgi:hypothetical protein
MKKDLNLPTGIKLEHTQSKESSHEQLKSQPNNHILQWRNWRKKETNEDKHIPSPILCILNRHIWRWQEKYDSE